MARRGKRRRDSLLAGESERIKHLKVQYAAELGELRPGSVARDAEEGDRLEAEASKRAEEREKLRPTYAPAYAPLRNGSPVVDQHDPWPEPEDDSRMTNEDRRADSYIRLSPPRADDHMLLDAYEAIGISEDALRRDRNRRHRKRTEILTASYQELRFSEEAEAEEGEIREWQMKETDQYRTHPSGEEIGDRMAVDDGAIQNEQDTMRADNLSIPHRTLSSGKEETRDSMAMDSNAVRIKQEPEDEVIVDDDATQNELRVKSEKSSTPPQGSQFAETVSSAVGYGNCTQSETADAPSSAVYQASRSVREEEAEDRATRPGGRASKSPEPQDGGRDWLHGSSDNLDLPINLYGPETPEPGEDVEKNDTSKEPPEPEVPVRVKIEPTEETAANSLGAILSRINSWLDGPPQPAMCKEDNGAARDTSLVQLEMDSPKPTSSIEPNQDEESTAKNGHSKAKVVPGP
ncbi:MAG: hypothetical protein M1839_001587 [Geoglossum umbratile]|nr:MAG: hypothetical protein M1839_001587 [Geoglossum umbratile]